mmetsp:Transcript_40976/g.36320  ORF Transcript_40976/g.36320 Transcript_40976/m.36320 type:complete len:274 (+) Transcript_40976:289-1110(+)|eukprot:CAMPEP_0114587838 /NCGR_PEP_ID=MMETSP0125-20121206/10698_1 /TAXON_ID=485358 ORGANISM="Aristerostoma sp., Strain ATCC 50986" /NCGR_SAMPLE_ID=MMETSP0125 /ASSEMBLY_ACC=CAM_ASM_000245 /LENGTH=273 /DNA_ID=CAMNT_0001783949 /DNA_START=249 /DNA_END=1070 /DNA_ORIENTATION=-
MKVFPYDEDRCISMSFLNELKFSSLSHPNVLNVIEARSKKSSRLKGKVVDISYMLLEYSPYGDITKSLLGGTIPNDEILMRTLFKQLLNGVEYLHSKDFAHMDLKIDNLLLSEDFNIKIADFEFCINHNEKFLNGKGTPNFRAPEVREKNCKDNFAADVFSVGVILFTFLARCLPFCEDTEIKGHNLFNLLQENPEEFWEIFEQFSDLDYNFPVTFKDLFQKMTLKDPKKRITIPEIKKSKWYRGPVYNQKELTRIMSSLNLKKLYEEKVETK